MQHSQIPDYVDTSRFNVWAECLIRMSNNFDISMPINGECSPSNITYEADMVACAMGVAPFCSVGNPDNYTLQDSISGMYSLSAGGWNDYAYSIFGVRSFGDINDLGNRLALWVASQHWSEVDNTSVGAGERILYALDSGIPDVESMKKMMDGSLGLVYRGIFNDQKEKPKIDISKYFNVDEMVNSREYA